MASGKRRKTDATVVSKDKKDEPTSKRRRQSVEAPKDAALPEGLKEVDDVYKVAGKVYVWGTGDCGQLGLGEDITEKLRPGPVNVGAEDDKVLHAVAGGMHTACVTESGAVYTWGVNDEGALGRFTEGELWRTHGKCTGTPGDSYVPQAVTMPAGAARVIMLSAGDSHTAALTAMGEVYVWGTFRDSGGVMGFSEDLKFSVAPRRVWTPISDADQCTSIASGNDHIAALTRGHTVLTWGSGQQGQLGRVGARMSDRQHSALQTFLRPAPMHLPYRLPADDKPARVSCGSYCTFVVTAGGRAYASGLNNYRQLGGGAEIICYGVKPVKALKDTPVAEIASGEHHTIALSKAGGVLSFGRPTYGRLGQPGAEVASDNPAATPAAAVVEDAGETPVTGVAAGSAVTGCFSEDAMCGMWLCGIGTSGQLAKGDDDDDEVTLAKVKRTKVFNAVCVRQLSFGGQHAVALCSPYAAAEDDA